MYIRAYCDRSMYGELLCNGALCLHNDNIRKGHDDDIEQDTRADVM